MGFQKAKPKPIDPSKKYTRPNAYSALNPRKQLSREDVDIALAEAARLASMQQRARASPAESKPQARAREAPLGGQRRIKVK